ncbi:MAG: ribonuclease R [candidate division Zixibacteria bacterium]|nr:ribonuclease R [candidate division Zixibacteria bacterium]
MEYKKELLKLMSKPDFRPVRIRELAKKIGIPEKHYKSFRNLVRTLVDDGKLMKMRGGKYNLVTEDMGGVGVFSSRRNGGGLIIRENGKAPLDAGYDLPRNLLHGDRVVFKLTNSGKPGGLQRARIMKIVERPGTTLIGIYRTTKNRAYLIPDDSRYPSRIPVDKSESKRAKSGLKVVAQVDARKDGDYSVECRITEVLGNPTDPHLDIIALIHSYGLQGDFPDAVIKEAQSLPRRNSRNEIEKREDFRGDTTFTIDPDNAKDFDDAVSARQLPGGKFELGVHIADVSHYVKEATSLDFEALQRGTSVYLVDRVIPMLPEILSNELCSLKPKVNRLTMSCIMTVDKNGRVVKSRIVDSIIHSNARLTYNQVQKYFDTGKGFARRKKISESLDKLRQLAAKMRERRFKDGSLDFDLPEPLITLDEDGQVVNITNYPRHESHRLIEEFMLAANVEVAKFAYGQGIPILYRVHGEPDEEKIENFIENLKEFGYTFSFKGKITLKKLQRVVEAVAGKPEERLINELLLRSMKKAVYQPQNIGHFALGFPAYAHFTSPIRRYPDLIVHRIIKSKINGTFTKRDLDKYRDSLPAIGELSSERERLAEEVERESIKVKTIQYASERIGQVVNGVISGMLKPGFFVELENMFIDGFVRYDDLLDDYYFYDEDRHRAVGRRTGNVYRLGDKVQVLINRVDRENRRIDLTIFSSRNSERKKKRRNLP